MNREIRTTRSIAVLLPAFACLWWGCASSPSVRPDAAPRAGDVASGTGANPGEDGISRPSVREQLEGEVLVRRNAWLYTRPSLEAERFRPIAVERALELWEVDRYAVVADHDGWLELQARDGPGLNLGRCMQVNADLRTYEARVFVQASSLVPAVREPVGFGFDDGTWIVLAPGAPVGPARAVDGWRTMHVEGVRFDVPLKEAQIGLSFRPLDALPGADFDSSIEDPMVDDAVFTYGGSERFKLSNRGTVSTTPRSVAPHGSGYFVRFNGGCFVAQLYAARNPFGSENMGIEGGIGSIGTGGAGDGSRGITIQAGAPVYWRDGSTAGRARLPIHLRADRVFQSGGRSCHRVVLGYSNEGPEAERTTAFCVGPEYVTEW